MKITHHPDAATLLAHSAGALDESHAIVVASHLDWCPDCLAASSVMENMGGALLEGIEPQPVSASARERLLARLTEPALERNGARKHPALNGAPAPLREVLAAPLHDLPWRRIGRGVALYDVPLSDAAAGKLRIWKLAPGKETPEHGHRGTEITMVLQGSLSDAIGTFRRGDVEDLGDDVEHRPVSGTGEECICMIASDAPTRFKGLLPRLLQPLLRF